MRTPIERLRDAYIHRLAGARAAHEAGLAVAGTWGEGIAPELLLATGHTPIAIAPRPDRGRTYSSRYFLPDMAPDTDAALDQLVSGELSLLRIALFASQAEEDFLLYNSAKEVLRLGEGGGLPPLWLYTLLGERHPAALDYGLDQTRRLARRLQAASGIRASDERIADAVALLNRVRSAGRRLAVAREAGRVGGVDALYVIGAGRFLPPEDYAPLLEAYVGGLDEAVAVPAAGPRLVLLSAAPLSTPTLHACIEEASATIIAEDSSWGSRAFGPDLQLEGDPLEAVFRYHHRHTPNRAIYGHRERLGWAYDQIDRGAVAGCIVYMPPSDTSLGWDYPRLKRYCDDRGKACLPVRGDISTPDGRANLLDQMRALVASMG